MDITSMRTQLRQEGVTIIRGLLSPDEVDHYVTLLQERSGINPETYSSDVSGRGFSRKGSGSSWNLTDGVTKTRPFWPLIVHRRLVETVRGLLGPEIRFLQHTDLHVGFSAISWHRDNVNRKYGVGPDWQEQAEPYRLVRCGIYLQRHEESGFRLGFVKGSHRLQADPGSLRTRQAEARFNWQGALAYLLPGMQLRAPGSVWIPTEPGDCLIFDPRAIHSGSYIRGPKYSMFVAYGIENRHFYNHQNYYRYVRQELGYEAPHPDLLQLLAETGLRQEKRPVFAEIEDAWLPNAVMRRAVGRRLKKAM